MIKNKNLFLYRTSKDSFFEEAQAIGFHEFKEKEFDWLKERQKIDHYGFSNILMLLPRSERDWQAFSYIKDLKVTLATTPQAYVKDNSLKEGNILLLVQNKVELHCLIENKEVFKGIEVLILGHKKFHPNAKVLKSLPNPLFFYFPLKGSLFDDRLSTREIKNYSNALEHGAIPMHPYPGLFFYEERAPFDVEFFPLLTPRWEKKRGDVSDSVIIPVFNQNKELGQTLKQLTSQNFSKRYEIIIVDDGSCDGLTHMIKSYLKELDSIAKIDYTYLRHCRVYPREMGDKRFRAGISRNIGLSFARGEVIHFIDADILVSPDYLKTINIDLNEAEVVQSQRYDLSTKGKGPEIAGWHDVRWERDIDLKSNPYWYDFFLNKQRWNELETPWKYICTYGLSLSRATIEEVGLISPNYIYYGFEDTDLGYQLYKRGKRFKLSSQIVYHQPHLAKRSEFQNSFLQRKRILSKSAPVFFLHNLDQKIYFELGDFIFPQYSLLQWLGHILTFGLLKKRV